METFLSIAQIVISIALTVVILLQERSSGIGGAFGGGGGGGSEVYQTRRGLEKVLLWATIILVVLFAGSAMISLFIQG